MKKIISLITVLAMLFTLPFMVSAFTMEEETFLYNDDELDLTQYTVDDLLNMSPDEVNAFITDFERVYDPFDSYDRKQEVNSINSRWTSGEGDMTSDDDGTHTYITMQACGILVNDIGFFSNNVTDNVSAIANIVLASNLPDDDETDLRTFAGHFYDPDTGKNYLGSSTNTAKANAIAHYQGAYAAASDDNLLSMYEKIGRCLHYIQDINVPHHAANIISTGVFSSHSKFETLAETNIDSYIGNLNTLTSNNYDSIAENYVRDIIDIAARDAKDKYSDLENSDSESETWDNVARFCTRKAVKYSTIIMYKLGQRSDVPFYYN